MNRTIKPVLYFHLLLNIANPVKAYIAAIMGHRMQKNAYGAYAVTSIPRTPAIYTPDVDHGIK